jgi:hypothetical protein
VTANPEVTVVFATTDFVRPRPVTVLIGSYDDFYTDNITDTTLAALENRYKAIPTASFDGVSFLAEEVYRFYVNFENGTNTTWFGERMLGWDFYGGVRDAWQKEMYFRMLRGFANYFHSIGKEVGITMHPATVMQSPWDGYAPPRLGPDYFFGNSGYNYILSNFDYVILYDYTNNLDDFLNLTKPYLAVVDALPQHLQKYWILTRPWGDTWQIWEREARALEMKNCLDRGIIIVTYQDAGPYTPNYNFTEAFNDMKKCVNLYETNQRYVESFVSATNLMTGITGTTYGYVSDIVGAP